MDWMLFCQIEVIILTFGLVAAFVISFHQTAKDNSWFKRTAALGEAFKTFGKEIASKNTAESAKVEVLNELVNAIKQEKQKKE